MAITIQREPQRFTPAFNPVVYVADSTNNAQPNFFYLFDIYVNNSVSFIARLSVPAHPVHGTAMADIQREVAAYVKYSVPAIAGAFTAHGESIAEVYVEVGERYDVAGVSTDFPALNTSATSYVYNAAIKPSEFLNYTHTNYLPQISAAKFLSDTPMISTVSDQQFGWLYFLNDSASPVDRARFAEIKTYNASGALIATFRLINNFSTVSTYDDRLQSVSFAPGSLNNIPPSEVVVGAQPIITAQVAKYTIQLMRTDLQYSSELRTFVINRNCNPFGQAEIYWLNRFGGINSYTFKARVDVPVTVEGQVYERNISRLESTGYVFNPSFPGQVQYSTMIQERLVVNTGYLWENESAWIADLIKSPYIYILDSDGVVPLVCNTRSITPATRLKNGKCMYTFEFNRYSPYTAQRQ